MPVKFIARRAKSPSGPRPTDDAINHFVEFFEAPDLPTARDAFLQSCKEVNLEPYGTMSDFFVKYKIALKEHVPYKYRDIWKILQKKASQKPYEGRLAEGSNVLIVGAGPCGLRTAIETQMLGATTVILERRDGFTRNNVLKLWKFLMEDLKSLGAKKLYGMFCAGNINHCGIKTLQLILSKVAMLLGIRMVTPCKFVDLIEPDDEGRGWRVKVDPTNEFLDTYEFRFLVIASGKNVPIEGFDRRSLDAKLSIAVTANFANNHTPEEAEVRQISGIAKHFHQAFFKDMSQEIGIDLENIVYYRGDTHYFVMTALKNCLLKRGVIKEDIDERDRLLAPSNIDKEKLHEFAIDVAQFSTGHFSVKLPTQEFALNARGAPDCAIFDFTNLYSARNACRVKVKKGRQLLMTVVGDSLLEPFWPEGTGCARGFLAAIDAAWMFRRWANGKLNPLEIICERENIYKLLSQTTDGSGGNLKDNHKQFTTDPSTRYRQIPKKIDHDHILPLYETDSPEEYEFLKEKFIKRQYYAREEHQKLLYRMKRKMFKRVTQKVLMPIRASNAFRRQQTQGPSTAPVQEEKTKDAVDVHETPKEPVSA